MAAYEAILGEIEPWEIDDKCDFWPDFPQSVFSPIQEPQIASAVQEMVLEPKIERTKRWTDDEDQLLLKLAGKKQPNWREIGHFFPGKPKSAVKRRWENKLNPDIRRTRWTSDEDQAITTLLVQIGPIWKEIAKFLPGRPPDMVKNRYYGHIKRLQDIKSRKIIESAAKTSLFQGFDSDWDTMLLKTTDDLLRFQEDEAQIRGNQVESDLLTS